MSEEKKDRSLNKDFAFKVTNKTYGTFCVYPFKKSGENIIDGEKRKVFGFGAAAPGKQDRHGQGDYAYTIEDLVKKIVFQGYSVRAKPPIKGSTGSSYQLYDEDFHTRQGNVDGYWLAPHLRYLVKGAKHQPISDAEYEKLTGIKFSSEKSVEKKMAELNAEIEKIASENKSLKGKDVEVIIKRRVGQSTFRKLLIEENGCKCALSGVDEEKLLRASHIKPWSEATPEEKTDPENGLLLSVIWDALFDQGLIAFHADGTIESSSLLTDDNIKKLGISLDIKLDEKYLTEKRKAYLLWHRTNVFGKNPKR